MITISEDEYHEHRENYDGFCQACNDFTSIGGVEPDARGYECDECGESLVFGVEEALLMGLLGIGGDNES